MRVWFIACCAVAVAAASPVALAFVDPPAIHPAEPTDVTQITLTYRYGECDALLDHSVEVTNSIAITIVKEIRSPPNCDVPDAEYEVSVGLLPPGAYSYRTFLQDSEPLSAPPVFFHTDRLTVTGSVAYISDLEVELIATPSVYLPPGTEGRITARFTNHGPDVTHRVAAVTPHVVQFGPTIPYEIYLGPFTTCDIWFSTFSPRPGQPLSARMVFNLNDPIAAGQSIECVIGFDSKPTASGAFTLQVVVDHSTSLNYTDPDPGNNQAELNFVFGQPPAPIVPVPALRPAGLLILFICFLVAIIRGRHV